MVVHEVVVPTLRFFSSEQKEKKSTFRYFISQKKKEEENLRKNKIKQKPIFFRMFF